MLFSVIPFIIILIPRAFKVSYSSKVYNIVVLISLVTAVFCLCYYFHYQVCISFIYIRVKKIILYGDIQAIHIFLIHSSFLASFYQHKYKKIHDRILEYAELERKIEMHVPYYEVQALMRKRDKHLMEKQIEMENDLQNPDITMTKDDFLPCFSKWIDSTRRSMDDPYSDQSKTKLNQVIICKLKPYYSKYMTHDQLPKLMDKCV